MTRRTQGRRVVGGVDTHKDLHVAAVVDEQDRVLGEPMLRHDPARLQADAGLDALLRVAPARRHRSDWHLRRGLLRYLQRAGVEVLEVTAPDKQDRRKRGKNDDLDAQNAAHAAFAGKRTVTPKSRDGMIESLRVLKACRKTAVAARRVALQMIHNTIVCAPDELRETLRRMTRMQLIRTLAAWRPDLTDYRNVASAYRITLKSLARRYLELHDEIADLDTMIVAIVDELAPDARGAELHRPRLRRAAAPDRRRQPGASALGGQLRRAMRREPGARFIRQDHPPSPQPRRRPGGQQRPAHHRHRPAADRSADQGLRREAHRRRPFQARGHPLPETLHRARGLHTDCSARREINQCHRRLTHRRASRAASSPQVFTSVLTRNRVAISMDGKGAWRDNVFVERLWRSVKYEEVYLRAYDTVAQARASISRYLDFYNTRRPHSSLDRRTPDQAYFTRLPQIAAA